MTSPLNNASRYILYRFHTKIFSFFYKKNTYLHLYLLGLTQLNNEVLYSMLHRQCGETRCPAYDRHGV